MDPIKPQGDEAAPANGSDLKTSVPALTTSKLETETTQSPATLQNASARSLPWSQSPVFASHNGAAPNFPQFSASTEEILKRVSANASVDTGSPSFEAAKAKILQSIVTSDRLPTPPPLPASGRRGGRGGRVGTPSTLKSEVKEDAKPVATTTATPTSGRGRGRGRGRGGGGRGGKRKRAESVDTEDDSDISTSYTPLPTKTKSGRNVNKPVAFVPVIPEPSSGNKRRRTTKAARPETALCKVCSRGTSPGNNMIVFCDGCNTPYHQYCHDPPIEKEAVQVIEKEWYCGPCARSRQTAVEGTEGLVSADNLTIEEKQAYFSSLPQSRLVSLLMHATIRHPELPLFPSNINSIISSLPAPGTNPQPQNFISLNTNSATGTPQAGPLSKATTSPAPNSGAMDTSGNTPRYVTTDSEVDPAEAQLLGEIRSSHQQDKPQGTSNSQTKPAPTNSNSRPQQQKQSPPRSVPAQSRTTQPQPNAQQSSSTNNASRGNDRDDRAEESEDDGYDTDPPAHYPKAGQGLARTLPPEREDYAQLADPNVEVFSHCWRDESGKMISNGGSMAESFLKRVNGLEKKEKEKEKEKLNGYGVVKGAVGKVGNLAGSVTSKIGS